MIKFATKIILISVCVLLFPNNFYAQENDMVQEGYAKIEKLSPGNLDVFSKKQTNFLYLSVVNHPVASLKQLSKYDPDGTIGFCFGRAMAAQLIARRMGLSNNSIRKLFVIGDLRSGINPEWRFHVTAIVRGNNDIWYAVDPIFTTPMKVEEWIQRVQATWDKQKKAKFYIDQASVVIPDLRHVPPISQETGEYVIEVSFDPEKHSFQHMFQYGSSTFETNSLNAYQYFTDVYEDAGNGFDFLKITINAEEYNYRSYFVDLIEAIRNAPDDEFSPEVKSLVEMLEEAHVSCSREANNLYSMRYSYFGNFGNK